MIARSRLLVPASLLAAVAGFCLASLAACGGGTPEPTTPATTGGGAPEGAANPAYAAASAAPLARTGAADAALAQGLKETSAWFAPGMVTDGSAYLATLDEHGHAKADVALHPGKCYVIVGFSQDGKVADFDLRLWKTARGAAPALVAEDADDDTTPTVGKPPICPDGEATYLLELVADKGKGDVAVQVYSKAR
jgi:hypothetical protein